MVSRTLTQHKKHLKGKFNEAEFSHLTKVLDSQKKIMQHSSNILFFSVIAVVFVLSIITSLIVLPFKTVLPAILFYGTYATSAFVLGVFAVYFIHINPEFEKHHHLFLLGLFVVFSFASVFLAHSILSMIMEGVVSGSMFSNWQVGLVASFGILIPYLLYWGLVE
ncbi:hypothetical protein CL619_02665 [archaeon]|nr:hypothetical protein [archaeon]